VTTVAEFMGSAAASPLNGSSAWASRYAGELRRVVVEHAARAPRTLQVALGPSEIGHECDRQVVGKMAGLPTTNHVTDPWPSIMGTAGHAWLADAFSADNARHGLRWVPEQRVEPAPGLTGTADLYDATWRALVDHKFLSDASAAKVRAPSGPAVHYLVQILLYGRGYRRLGLPVDRVALAVWPRTGSSLDGLYVWERPYTAEDDRIVDEVLVRTRLRAAVAEQVRGGVLSITQVPARPDPDTCYFCPLYRPQSARDGGPGCPGTAGAG